MHGRNPFLTSGYENPEFFCDRVEETNDLIEALENDRNVTLMAPRRYGKSGLIENAFFKLRQDHGYQTVIVDVFPAQDLASFTSLFAREVFRPLETTVEKAPSSTSELLSRLVEKELVYKTDAGHVVYDRLFGEWLAL